MQFVTDSIRGILEGHGRTEAARAQFPYRACQAGAHLGPVNYDGDAPLCERCGAVLVVGSQGSFLTVAPRTQTPEPGSGSA